MAIPWVSHWQEDADSMVGLEWKNLDQCSTEDIGRIVVLYSKDRIW